LLRKLTHGLGLLSETDQIPTKRLSSSIRPRIKQSTSANPVPTGRRNDNPTGGWAHLGLTNLIDAPFNVLDSEVVDRRSFRKGMTELDERLDEACECGGRFGLPGWARRLEVGLKWRVNEGLEVKTDGERAKLTEEEDDGGGEA
jgi:hypothetical protein